MTVETLHAPHGTKDVPFSRRGDFFTCEKCLTAFPALCVLLDHLRKDHGDKLAPLMR